MTKWNDLVEVVAAEIYEPPAESTSSLEAQRREAAAHARAKRKADAALRALLAKGFVIVPKKIPAGMGWVLDQAMLKDIDLDSYPNGYPGGARGYHDDIYEPQWDAALSAGSIKPEEK
jgi:uncharacterized protein YbjT (DUF2867 family)